MLDIEKADNSFKNIQNPARPAGTKQHRAKDGTLQRNPCNIPQKRPSMLKRCLRIKKRKNQIKEFQVLAFILNLEEIINKQQKNIKMKIIKKTTCYRHTLLWAVILVLGLGTASSCSNSQNSKSTSDEDTTALEEDPYAIPSDTKPMTEAEKEIEQHSNGNIPNKNAVTIPGFNTETEVVSEFLKGFYAHYVFGNESMERIAKDVCTPRLLDYLKRQYDYDCPDGPCYAMWCFRTGMQDGPSDVSKVTSVKAENDGWFKVSYLDMGNHGTTRIRFIMMKGKYRMDEIEQVK